MRPSTGRSTVRLSAGTGIDDRRFNRELRPRRATGGGIGLLGLLLLLSSASLCPAQSTAQAEQVMAAFVSRFPQFVEWPESSLTDRTTLDICVWEPDPFGPVLERLVETEQLNGRFLAVRPIDRTELLEDCHVLFLPSGTARPGTLLAELDGRPILTIGETPDFLDLGGIINLLIIGRRVRFEVNVAAAERAGLRLSSQLLGLAIDVRGRT